MRKGVALYTCPFTVGVAFTSCYTRRANACSRIQRRLGGRRYQRAHPLPILSQISLRSDLIALQMSRESIEKHRSGLPFLVKEGLLNSECTNYFACVFHRWLACRNRSEEHTSELQSLAYLVCRLLLEKKKKNST